MEYDWIWCPDEISFQPSYSVHTPEFGKQSHGYRSAFWTFKLTLPPKAYDERRAIEAFLARTEGTAIVNVYDPRVAVPKIFENAASPVIPGLSVSAMDRNAKTIDVSGVSGDVISQGDPIAFTQSNRRYYFKAMQDLTLSGAVQPLEVFITPRETRAFAPVVANREKATCRFLIDINKIGGTTTVNKVTDFELEGIEYWGTLT